MQLSINFCSLEFWDPDKMFHGYGNKFISIIFIIENTMWSHNSSHKLDQASSRRWVCAEKSSYFKKYGEFWAGFWKFRSFRDVCIIIQSFKFLRLVVSELKVSPVKYVFLNKYLLRNKLIRLFLTNLAIYIQINLRPTNQPTNQLTSNLFRWCGTSCPAKSKAFWLLSWAKIFI